LKVDESCPACSVSSVYSVVLALKRNHGIHRKHGIRKAFGGYPLLNYPGRIEDTDRNQLSHALLFTLRYLRDSLESTMEELIKKVSERAGITEDQARTAVETVAEYLKEKVPAPYSSYIDSFMSGGTGGGLGSLLGGMFGKK